MRAEMGAPRGRGPRTKLLFGALAVAGWRDVQASCRVRDQVGCKASGNWDSEIDCKIRIPCKRYMKAVMSGSDDSPSPARPHRSRCVFYQPAGSAVPLLHRTSRH